MDNLDFIKYTPSRAYFNSFEHLSNIWRKIEDEGKLDAICPSVDPEKWGFKGFLQSIRESEFWQVALKDEIIGCAWLQNFKPFRAEIHFVTFGLNRMKTKYALVFLKYLLKYYGLRVIYGFVPINNLSAIKFARKAGCEISGIIPKGSYNFRDSDNYDSVLVTYFEKQRICPNENL